MISLCPQQNIYNCFFMTNLIQGYIKALTWSFFFVLYVTFLLYVCFYWYASPVNQNRICSIVYNLKNVKNTHGGMLFLVNYYF